MKNRYINGLEKDNDNKMEGVKFQKGVETSMHRRANVYNNEDYYLGISLYSLSGGGNDNQQKIEKKIMT